MLPKIMETETMFIPLSTPVCNSKLASVGDALYVIGGKWKLRIIIALNGGNTRFNELQHAIPGISAKVLSNELKDMELSGFVTRTVDTGTPVVVTYTPTTYTHTLKNVLEALADWGTMHREKLRAEAIR